MVPPRPPRRSLGRMIVVVGALALALPACADGPLGADAAVVTEAGDLEVRSGGVWGPAEEGDVLGAATEVRTGAVEARLLLNDGELWLGSGAAALVHRDRVELLQGDGLLRADRDLTLAWETLEVHGVGVFRIGLGSAPRVGVYQGQVTVSRPGERTVVPALRQVVLAGRRLPGPLPLRYRSDDPWDEIWMDRALQLDGEAERLARGIERSYGTEPQTPGFYGQFAPDADQALTLLARTARVRGPDERFGPPADTLLALFLAQATDRSPLVDAVGRVVALRADGARWGLVGVELEVSTERLAAVVDLGHAQQVASAPPPPPPPAQIESSTPPEPGAPPSGSQPPPVPPPGPAPPASPPPPPPPGDDPAGNPLTELTDPLQGLLEEAIEPVLESLRID